MRCRSNGFYRHKREIKIMTQICVDFNEKKGENHMCIFDEEDCFFHRPEAEEYEVIYYNPDALSGGQFVVLHLPYDLIVQAKKNTVTTDEFFAYFDERAYTELVDLETPEFDKIKSSELIPTFIGRNEKTMAALVRQANNFKEKKIC